MRQRLGPLLGFILCTVLLYGSKDQPCHESFRLTAEPIKRVYTKGEPVTIRLSFTNSTSHEVYIAPHLFPFDYWVDKHGNGRWIALSTGIVGPNAKERHIGSMGSAQPSEYRRIRAGETFTAEFEVELNSITKATAGTFRLNTVRAHVYASDSSANNVGCAIFASESATFRVQ
jgi:hypothetical protein